MARLILLGEIPQAKKRDILYIGQLLHDETAEAQDTMIPPASHHQGHIGRSNHLTDIVIIFGPNGVRCPVQDLGIHAPESENVQHEHPVVTPPLGESDAPAHRGVILDLIGGAGVQADKNHLGGLDEFISI